MTEPDLIQSRIGDAIPPQAPSPNLEKLFVDLCCNWTLSARLLHRDDLKKQHVYISGGYYCLHSIQCPVLGWHSNCWPYLSSRIVQPTNIHFVLQMMLAWTGSVELQENVSSSQNQQSTWCKNAQTFQTPEYAHAEKQNQPKCTSNLTIFTTATEFCFSFRTVLTQLAFVTYYASSRAVRPYWRTWTSWIRNTPAIFTTDANISND